MSDFTTWMSKIDGILGTIGVDHRDLPDIAYFDLFDDGATPEDAAEEALIEAGAEQNVIDLAIG